MDIFGFFNKIGTILSLSILWFIFSLPIITLGASTVAYCYILNKVIHNQEGYIIKSFIKAFKENFKTSVVVWLILLVLSIITTGNLSYIWCMSKTEGGVYIYLTPIYLMLLLLVIFITIYAFAYMAFFENTPFNIIKNSFLMSTRHLGYTLIILFSDALILLFGFLIFLPIVLISPALIGFINVGILNFVFDRYKYNN